VPFDGLTIRAVTKELHSKYLNARIEKIYQPEKDELVLNLHSFVSGNTKLVISANSRWSRMHITTEKRDNPTFPPNFCMLLRKHLEGGKIKGIKQVGFERIVHINIEALDDFGEWKEKLLVCEFMGRHSNIIFLDPANNLIIDAIKKIGSEVSTHREVLPGKIYIFPPGQGKISPTNTPYEEFVQAMWNQPPETSIAQALFHTYTGISPFSAQQLCKLAGLDATHPVDQAGEFELSKLYSGIQSLINELNDGKTRSVLAWSNNSPLEFAPYPLEGLAHADRYTCLDSINQACDVFYTSKLNANRLESLKVNLIRNVKNQLDKAYNRKFLQEQDMAKAKENNIYKKWGELLIAYSYQIKKGDTEVLLADFTGNEKHLIELDPRFNAIQNAQRFFKKYNKSRKATDHLKKRLAATEQEITYLESVLVTLQQAATNSEVEEIITELENEKVIRKRPRRPRIEQKSNPRRFLSSDHLEILVGRNNRQNDWLTLKFANNKDLWLHTKQIPGSHVIVKLPKDYSSIEDCPETTLIEAATIAAYFSKARESSKVEVDYTFKSNVRKPSGAKPGMVIYDNYWTITVNPQAESIADLLKKEIE